MKISIIVHGRFHAFDLAREFERAGCLHQLITTYPRFVTKRFGIPSEKVVSLSGFGAALRLFSRVVKDQSINNRFETFVTKKFAQQAARLLEPCDVLIAWSSVGTPAFKKARSWGALCICERGSDHVLHQEQVLKEEYDLQGFPWVAWTPQKRQLELDDYQYADFVSIPSSFVKNSFIQQHFPSQRLIQVPYGTDLTQFHPLSPANDAERPFRVLFVGSQSIRKGVGYLEKAFLEANIPNSELWFVGSAAPETARLLQSTDSRIRRFDAVAQSELLHIYSQCDVFVMPSIGEGLALVQAQALACGLPLITTTNTGGEDLLSLSIQSPLQLDQDTLQYPAGFVVPIRRSDALARCIRRLYEDADLLAMMRAEALAIAKNQFDWSYRAAELIEHYQRLLREKTTITA